MNVSMPVLSGKSPKRNGGRARPPSVSMLQFLLLEETVFFGDRAAIPMNVFHLGHPPRMLNMASLPSAVPAPPFIVVVVVMVTVMIAGAVSVRDDDRLSM